MNANGRGRPWRMVEWVFDATVPNPEVGPWTPLAFAGGRGQPGPPAWGWRDSSGAFYWEDGVPPAPLGVLCDETWHPFAVADLPDLVRCTGGWSRSQAHRQKAYTASA